MKRIGVLVAALVLCGCGDLMFVEPLATESDTLFDTSLLGSWADGDNTVVRVTAEHPPTYQVRLLFVESGKISQLEGRLAWFEDDKRILDLQDPEPGLFNVAMHVWLDVRKKGDSLTVSFLDSKWLREQLQPAGLPSFLAERHPVVTASQSRLREFAARYGVRPEAREEPIELKPFKKKKPTQ